MALKVDWETVRNSPPYQAANRILQTIADYGDSPRVREVIVGEILLAQAIAVAEFKAGTLVMTDSQRAIIDAYRNVQESSSELHRATVSKRAHSDTVRS